MSGYEALPWVQYSEFLDHLKTALLVVDNDTVVYANAAAAHITGHQSPAELVGIRLATVLAPDLYVPIRKAYETLYQRNLPAIRLTGVACGEGQQRRYLDVHVARLQVEAHCIIVLLLYDQTLLTGALHRSQEAEKRLADLIGTLPGVVWEYDRRQKAFTFLSDYARVLTGYQTEVFLKDSALFFQQVHPDDVEQFQRIWQQLTQTQQPCSWRFRLRVGDQGSEWRWLEAKIVPVFDHKGNLAKVRGVSYDIHREVETQQLLQQRTQQLEALIQFSSRFVEVQSEEEVLVTLCDLLNCTLDFKHVAVFLRRQSGLLEKAIIKRGMVRWNKVDEGLNDGDSRLSHVLDGRIPYFVAQDTLEEVSQREREVWKRVLGHEIGRFSNALVPIRGRSQVLGVLAVDRRDTRAPITDSEVSMLLTIGRYAGLALDNVRLMHERQVAEERLRHLVQNLPATVWELNLATRKLDFVSEYVEQWLGYTPEEWLKNPGMYRTVVHPEDMETFERVINPDVTGALQPLEVRLRDKQGRWRWCRILWSLQHQNGGGMLVRGVTTDITEQKQAEHQQLHLMRLRSLGEIASGVAHNFNNLLMGILGNAELLQASLQHDRELQRRAEVIAQLAHDASAIVKRMQGFYKLQPPTRRERVRLRALLEDVKESTRPVWHDMAARRGAEVRVHLVADSDPVVLANRTELHEVFTNMVINACDAMPASHQTVSSSRLRILTVDDDEAVSAAIMHVLQADGHQVTAVSDAISALTQFQLGRYDVAILDLRMPHLDGLSLARQLKEMSPSLLIILLTGWGDQLREDKPPEVDMVLAKPVRRATLRAALLQLAKR
jgi:PAS domain S-box-containing protein